MAPGEIDQPASVRVHEENVSDSGPVGLKSYLGAIGRPGNGAISLGMSGDVHRFSAVNSHDEDIQVAVAIGFKDEMLTVRRPRRTAVRGGFREIGTDASGHADNNGHCQQGSFGYNL